MGLDLSSYPPTENGALSMIEALAPRIIRLWKVEREELRSDDLIAVINANTNQVRIDNREKVYQKIKRLDHNLDLLERVTKRPIQVNGTVKIWALIGFPEGQICVLPFVLAYS
jgi:hypothetical protein